jgi:acyl carrier protein
MDETLRPRIKEVLVKSLRLPYPATEIADDIPLFGEGLGLDSIDALELVLEIERTFGVAIGDEQTPSGR